MPGPGEIEQKLGAALARPIPPKPVNTSPTREVVLTGDKVDLFKLPIPMSSIYDGGPMITAGVVIARDPELGWNSGIYRFIVKEKNLTGIDIVTPNNMRLFAERALKAGRPCPISISIGTHPFEIMGSGYRAPMGVDKMAIAGGLRGSPVALAPCETIDMPYIADAEIVLEAEILPTGWTWPEGPVRRVHPAHGRAPLEPAGAGQGDRRRKDAIYYALHMPWENTWLAAPTRYTAIRQALRTAGVQVKDINVTLGGCAFWHAVISIKKQAGEGKNALLAALSVMDLKHVVVVDDDIDVLNPTDVEWAIATRVQADRDVMIVSNARGKPLGPEPAPVPMGQVPTTAKSASTPPSPKACRKERYERIAYAYADRAKIADDATGKDRQARPAAAGGAVPDLAQRILDPIDEAPLYYTEIAERLADFDFQAVARALGQLHATEKLWQDPGAGCRARLALRRQAAGVPCVLRTVLVLCCRHQR